MRDERDLERVFRRDLGRVGLPPREAWIPTTRRSWTRTALAAPLIAVLLVAAAGLGLALGQRRLVAEPSPLPPPSDVAAAASRSPGIAPVQSSASPAVAIPGVEVHPLGGMKGDFVFAARVVNGPTPWGTHELWAIPLEGGQQARVVLRYARTSFNDAWPARQLSADGKRFVLTSRAADGWDRLLVADLLTGSVTSLPLADSGIHDRQPVWDPTGTRIAFGRTRAEAGAAQGRDDGLWVVNADGTGLKQLVTPAGPPTYIYGWTADGRYVTFAQNTGFDLVDATSGARVSMAKVTSGDASWRSASPRLVASDRSIIFTADDPSGPRDVLVRGTSPTDFVSNPRWRPGHDEFFYYLRGTLRVRSLSGSDRSLVASGVGSPAWSPDGSSIVYIHIETVALPSPTPCPSSAMPQVIVICGEGPTAAAVATQIRVVNTDGTNDHSLYRTTDPAGGNVPGWCICVDGLATRRF